MRRLSAIMFTDMVGYSALSQKDEALALRLLEEHRTILRPFFTKHEGREIETAGDLFFVEFDSAVEAANCAIEIQCALHERNETEEPDNQILLRIGLHIGDVVYMDKHVHGDGVNIAARIEPLANPGGICVSEDVARQIRNKIQNPLIKIGQRKLKNISVPIDIYSIQLPWQNHGAPTAKTFVTDKKIRWSAAILGALIVAAFILIPKNQKSTNLSNSKFRLAVLPLANISADTKDEYFADGMTEELISSLSKINGLRVIARSSIMKYKGLKKDISEIGHELMVGSILEGSVRKVNDKARISIQLIDVSTQEHLWSMNYDRDLQDIFMIQSEIAQNVATKLKIILASAEKKQLEKNYTDNIAAFQEYLIGKHFLNTRTSEGLRMAVNHLEKSVEHDPAFALAYANLAYCYTLISGAGFGGIPADIAGKKARESVVKALEVDDTLAEAHAALAYLRFRMDWDWAGADKEFMRAIELKPGYATAHEWYALFLSTQNRSDEALEQMMLAYELDPLSSSVNTGLGRILHFREEMDKSIEQFKKTLAMDPNYAEAYFGLSMAHFKIADYKKAEEELMKAIELSGRRPVMLGFLGMIYTSTNRTKEAQQLLKELQSAPVNNDNLYASSMVLIGLNRLDEAEKILLKLYEEKYGVLVYFFIEGSFFNDEMNAKIHEIARRMKNT